MTILIEMRFGSHLFGTATPASDFDVKQVFVPPAAEILLQRINPHKSNRRSDGLKTLPGTVEEEAFALHRYLELLAEGQTTALDMLFAPAGMWLSQPHPAWLRLRANRQRLLSSGTTKFVQYCFRQAKKYGIKGSRIQALRSVIAWFDTMSAAHGDVRLEAVSDSVAEFVASCEHAGIRVIPQIGGQELAHLECCDLLASYRIRLVAGRAIYQHALDRYGQRALMAETNQGVDWKAMSHAVRIAQEALQLLTTGEITFPRPQAAHLLAIKLGQLPYQQVAEELEGLIEQIAQEQPRSRLPEQPDQEYIDEVVCEVYGEAVRESWLRRLDLNQ